MGSLSQWSRDPLHTSRLQLWTFVLKKGTETLILIISLLKEDVYSEVEIGALMTPLSRFPFS